MLILELDGGMHDLRRTEDALRDRELETLGFLILRIKNHELKNQTEWCKERIRIALEREIT